MELFESKEKGAGEQLRKFLDEGHFKYDIGVKKLVYKPSQSIFEFLDWQLIKGVFQLHVFQTIGKYIRKYFTHPELIKLLEFPVLFLGGTPQNTPALYSLMNYSDMVLGTWYPVGGMYEVVKAMVTLAESLGVKIHTNAAVSKIEVENKKATGVWVNGEFHKFDYIVGGADYHHVEKHLLAKEYQSYSDKYWDERVLAPSALLYYVGVNKELANVLHHILFFDEDFTHHAKEIYDNPQFPSKPLFYVSCASKTDKSVAPEGCDALVLLIPVAPGLVDTEEIREKYYNLIMERMEKLTGQEIRSHVVFKQSYAQSDFIKDYNSLKGNAYGLANTLMQTAIFKPALQSKKVKNLFFTGQLTVPGPGVPPAIISGEVVAKVIMEQAN
jgi:phytoene desaturase